jgi:hypothetical protein
VLLFAPTNFRCKRGCLNESFGEYSSMTKKSILIINEIKHRLQEKRFQRSHKSKLNKKAKRRLEATRNSQHYEKSRFSQKLKLHNLPKNDRYKDIILPEILDLTNPNDLTLELVRDIRKIVLIERRSVRLIFNEARDILPGSLLLLLAEIHRCRLIHGNSKLTGTYPEKGSSLEKLLHATGFFSLLNVKSSVENEPKRYPVEHVQFISDVKPPIGLNKRFRESMFGEKIEINMRMRKHIFRAIGEAIINVGQHAYPNDSRQMHPTRNRWWLSGHINKINSQMTIMFCDLGVSIPRTLPKRYPMEIIGSVLSILPGIKLNDGQMIKAGMAIGRSQTYESNRGKGLNDMRRIIDEAGEGELHIFSRKGCYRYSPGKPDQIRNFDIAVDGTLIKWTVPLNKVTEWREGDEYETS